MLLLVTYAKRQNSRIVSLGPASDILRFLGKSIDGRSYKWLGEAFDRIFSSTVFWGTDSALLGAKLIDKARIHMVDRVKLWYEEDDREHGVPFENRVHLAEQFWEEIRVHGLPVDIVVARALADKPFTYDFYIWLAFRCILIPKGERVSVPLFGELSLQQQLGSSIQSRTKYRQVIRQALQEVLCFWPGCTAKLSPDSNSLTLSFCEAINPTKAIEAGSEEMR
jgi:hypothetical protein